MESNTGRTARESDRFLPGGCGTLLNSSMPWKNGNKWMLSMISVHMSSDRENVERKLYACVGHPGHCSISVLSCRQRSLNNNEWQLRKKPTTEHSQAVLDQTLTSCPDCSCLMMPQLETQGRPNLPRPSQTSGYQEFAFQKVLWCRWEGEGVAAPGTILDFPLSSHRLSKTPICFSIYDSMRT